MTLNFVLVFDTLCPAWYSQGIAHFLEHMLFMVKPLTLFCQHFPVVSPLFGYCKCIVLHLVRLNMKALIDLQYCCGLPPFFLSHQFMLYNHAFTFEFSHLTSPLHCCARPCIY